MVPPLKILFKKKKKKKKKKKEKLIRYTCEKIYVPIIK